LLVVTSFTLIVCRSPRPPRSTLFPYTTLFRSVVAQNDDWSVPTPLTPLQTVATAAELTATAQAVGAFALAAGSRDAAVIVTLAPDRKSTRLNSSHSQISYAVFCLKKKKKTQKRRNTSRLSNYITTEKAAQYHHNN